MRGYLALINRIDTGNTGLNECLYLELIGGRGMDEKCVTKAEAGKLLGVSVRQIDKYLKSGELTVHHREKRNTVMISVTEVYNLREKKKERK